MIYNTTKTDKIMRTLIQKKAKQTTTMTTYAIYNATYSELKGKPSVEFKIQEYSYIAGGDISIKDCNIKKYNILVTDEDDSELCRKEIMQFVSTLGIVVSNIENEFQIL